MKYLTEEKFVVGARDAEAQKRYVEGWERTFGEKKDETPTPVERFTWSHDSPNCDNNCDCYERAYAAAQRRSVERAQRTNR